MWPGARPVVGEVKMPALASCLTFRAVMLQGGSDMISKSTFLTHLTGISSVGHVLGDLRHSPFSDPVTGHS